MTGKRKKRRIARPFRCPPGPGGLAERFALW